MKAIEIPELIIDEGRQRQSFDEETIKELALSISTIGLLHPIILQSDEQTLIAGEYRTKALQFLLDNGHNHYMHDGQVIELPYIPYNTVEELSEADIFRVELEENLRRKALTWQEQARALGELQTRMMDANKNTSQKVTMTKVAQEVADLSGTPLRPKDIEQTTKAIQILPFLDNPEVASAPSLKDAEQAAKKIITKDFENVLAETGSKKVAETVAKASTPKTTRAHITIKHGNYQDNLAEGVDLYLMDPPYFVGAENFGTQSAVGHDYNDTALTEEEITHFYYTLAKHCMDKANDQCHVYMFFEFIHWDKVKYAFEENGWNVWRKPLMWVKDVGMYPDPDHGPRYTYECIMMASRGRKTFNGAYNDTFSCPTVKNKVHGAQKPAALIKALAKTSITDGDLVVDYFGGSGAIIDALKDEAIFLHVVELNQDSYNLCMEKV